MAIMKKQWIPYTCKVCGKHGYTCQSLPRKTCSHDCANKSFENTDQDFWKFVNKTDSCWIWTGNVRNGYGRFSIKSDGIFAHRYSWQLCRGSIPEGICVLHNCPGGDNPLCVNPDHLFLGTQVDNNKDKVAKNRQSRGEDQGCSKLTTEAVREIRRLPSSTLISLAQRFGVHLATIHHVRHGKTWRHVV